MIKMIKICIYLEVWPNDSDESGYNDIYFGSNYSYRIKYDNLDKVDNDLVSDDDVDDDDHDDSNHGGDEIFADILVAMFRLIS